MKFPKTQGTEVEVGGVEHGTVYYIGLGKSYRDPDWMHIWLLRNESGKLLDVHKNPKKLAKKTAVKKFENWRPMEKYEGPEYEFKDGTGNVTIGERAGKIGF